MTGHTTHNEGGSGGLCFATPSQGLRAVQRIRPLLPEHEDSLNRVPLGLTGLTIQAASYSIFSVTFRRGFVWKR
jgi:hypothetical protein